MKKILVTTDLSEESKRAFSLTKEIALAFDGEVTLLAIIEDPAQAAMIYAMDFPVHADADVLKQLRDKVERDLIEYKKKYFDGVKISTVIREASRAVHDEITHYADEIDADLIVMATIGRTGFTRFLLGSVTEKVLREATRPVLTVPAS